MNFEGRKTKNSNCKRSKKVVIIEKLAFNVLTKINQFNKMQKMTSSRINPS
jgi:hypothetical protein